VQTSAAISYVTASNASGDYAVLHEINKPNTTKPNITPDNTAINGQKAVSIYT